MKKIYLLVILVIVTIVAIMGFSSYNSLAAAEQTVNQSWANVETQYQRRLDLIPNLVQTVKGQKDFEQETLVKVTQARASATQIKLDASDLTEEKLAQFQAVQRKLQSSLGRLLAVSENYPTLQTNQGFMNLQAQLEGTENRISFARDNYNKIVSAYNTKLVTFPNAIYAKIFGFKVKPYFKANLGADQAPTVSF